MNQQELLTLQKQLNEDIKITSSNILEKSIELPSLYKKYLDIFLLESKLLKKLEIVKNITYKNKYHFYKFEFNHSLDSKSEIESYIKGDKDFVSDSGNYELQEVIVTYLEKSLELLKNAGFAVKNYIEYRKFLEAT